MAPFMYEWDRTVRIDGWMDGLMKKFYSKFRNIFPKILSGKLLNLVLLRFIVEMNMEELVEVDLMHPLFSKHYPKDVSVRQLILAFISMQKMINENISHE